jgi:tRNA U55 pseudouridine synthase TruB
VIDQVPPDYSAIKIDGARAYDLARQADAGQPLPALKPREVRIDHFRRLDSIRLARGFLSDAAKVPISVRWRVIWGGLWAAPRM